MTRTVYCIGSKLVLGATLVLGACDAPETGLIAPAPAIERGATALRDYGCGACHRIPGIVGAQGNVGPSLDGIATRVYLAGVLPNSRDNLARWIREPHLISPATAMPDMQVTAADAAAMAAYFYRIR